MTHQVETTWLKPLGFNRLKVHHPPFQKIFRFFRCQPAPLQRGRRRRRRRRGYSRQRRRRPRGGYAGRDADGASGARHAVRWGDLASLLSVASCANFIITVHRFFWFWSADLSVLGAFGQKRQSANFIFTVYRFFFFWVGGPFRTGRLWPKTSKRAKKKPPPQTWGRHKPELRTRVPLQRVTMRYNAAMPVIRRGREEPSVFASWRTLHTPRIYHVCWSVYLS